MFSRVVAAGGALLLVAAGLTACAAGSTDGVGSVVPSSPPAAPAPSPTSCAGACVTDTRGVAAVLSAARAGVIAANTYDYRSLPVARARAVPLLTGSYLRQYESALDTIVTPTATKLHAVQTATVSVVAVSSLAAGSASTLVAGQIRITQQNATPRIDQFTLSAHLTLSGAHWLIDDVHLNGGTRSGRLGSAALDAAVRAGTQEVVNVLSYRRASFDSDFARAVDGATGTLRTDILADKARTRATQTSGKFDLSATVTGSGVTSVEPDTVVLLVLANGYRSNRPTVPTPQTLRVTVVRSAARWLVDDLEPVAAS